MKFRKIRMINLKLTIDIQIMRGVIELIILY